MWQAELGKSILRSAERLAPEARATAENGALNLLSCVAERIGATRALGLTSTQEGYGITRSVATNGGSRSTEYSSEQAISKVTAGAPTIAPVKGIKFIREIPPPFSPIEAPLAEDAEILRSLDRVPIAKDSLFKREFLVTSGNPFRWYDATNAGDKSIQEMITGRELLQGQSAGYSMLGPEAKILMQHFNGNTELLNEPFARRADIIMACYRERMPAFAQTKHVFQDVSGPINMYPTRYFFEAVPSRQAIAVRVGNWSV
jgi:hypothetical protein